MKRFLYFPMIMLLAFACTNQDTTSANQVEESKTEPVEVMLVQAQTIARDVEYMASLLAWEELHYAPASPGRIDQIYVEVGQKVKQGELLVLMDQTQLHQAEVQLKTVETDFARLDTLYKTASISKQQYDQLKSQLEIAQSNVSFLRKNTSLIAPFDAVVSGKYFEAGEMFSGTPVPTIGKAAVVSLVQMNRLKLLVSISEKYFPLINKGMPAKVTSDIYPDRNFEGKVFNVYPTVDPLSRSFNVEVAIENKEELLRPGMFCRVRLELDQEEAILLPSIAILKLQGSNDRYLFIEKDGLAHRIPVHIGKRYNEFVEVISDELKAGDRLIVRGQARLLDEMPVQVIK